MNEWAFNLVLVWHGALVLLLLGHAMRAAKLIDRVIAFEALSMVFVASIALIAIQRKEAYYLDIALVVAMLGFVQTVATVRLLERRGTLQ